MKSFRMAHRPGNNQGCASCGNGFRRRWEGRGERGIWTGSNVEQSNRTAAGGPVRSRTVAPPESAHWPRALHRRPGRRDSCRLRRSPRYVRQLRRNGRHRGDGGASADAASPAPQHLQRTRSRQPPRGAHRQVPTCTPLAPASAAQRRAQPALRSAAGRQACASACIHFAYSTGHPAWEFILHIRTIC